MEDNNKYFGDYSIIYLKEINDIAVLIHKQLGTDHFYYKYLIHMVDKDEKHYKTKGVCDISTLSIARNIERKIHNIYGENKKIRSRKTK